MDSVFPPNESWIIYRFSLSRNQVTNQATAGAGVGKVKEGHGMIFQHKRADALNIVTGGTSLSPSQTETHAHTQMRPWFRTVSFSQTVAGHAVVNRC